MIETIYCYHEHAIRAGEVVRAEVETDGEGYPVDDAIFRWGEGDRESLIEMARTDVARHQENAPSFTRRCALNVLDYLGVDVEEDEVPA